MSGLVMADEVARFNEGERVMARLYAFLALFLWPLSYVAAWIGVSLAAALVGIDLPDWLAIPLRLAVVGALVWQARRMLRRLRELDAALDAFYAVPAAERPAAAERVAALRPPDPETMPAVLRFALTARSWLLAAPRCTVMCLRNRTSRLDWDDAQLAGAKAAFEALGGNGGAWVPCADHTAVAGQLAGMERMGLIEHRVAEGRAEIRIHPDMRRRHFPKDPAAQAAFPPASRRY
jgi:hypothetical protein